MTGIISDNGDSGGEVELHTFPCAIEIKAIGLQTNRLVAIVESIVGRHVPQEEILSTYSRLSSAGKYLSVTCRVKARSRNQLDAVYQDLTACEDVVMAL